ncbi:hypothetical protein [Bradyrhizobium sp. CCBAU 11361]|uniref:hypothetical protein n=1 Tax=Bradyrhizobium sp. CCBAU 11361 TaxID=1630812 RepID=UPI002302F7E4|nr:hypothetical protein [Bradyrhizobium sp. CCBAU 11361]MDA9489671.1 hypothetical protein [Bradyrhizobium sp. CCBAU 11361]
MSKRFKGKTCVYCAAAGASDTGDHVLARGFVGAEHHGQIPKVPACVACNNKKSGLETYCAGVLPFGGRHADALENLAANVPKRLAKNQKLHRTLAAGQTRVWSREPSGLLVNTMALPLDGERLEELVGLIARGLMFHHWGVILGPDIVVDVLSLTKHGETFFAGHLNLNAKQRVTNDIGKGALTYEGVQAVDNDAISFWTLSLYGSLVMDGGDGEHFMSKFGVMTGPKTVAERAAQRVASGNYIIRP